MAWLTPAASASVITFASSDLILPHTGDVDQLQYGYNQSSLGTGVGFGTFNSLSACTGESYTCSGTGTGTLDTSGLLTSSYDQASASALGNDGSTFSSSASAVANLASGTVGAAASGTPYSNVGGDGIAYAQANDGLDFFVAGAGSNDVTDITVTFSVDGTYTGLPSPAVSAYLGFGNANTTISLTPDYQTGALVVETGNNGWVSASLLSDTPNDIVFSGVYALTGPVTDLGIQFQIGAHCGEGSSCDYSHTGAVGLSLPGDVSFTSNSGVFLTDATPEPDSVVLIAGGLGALAAFAALRKNANLRRWSPGQAKSHNS